jgi:hypothetical protein
MQITWYLMLSCFQFRHSEILLTHPNSILSTIIRDMNHDYNLGHVFTEPRSWDFGNYWISKSTLLLFIYAVLLFYVSCFKLPIRFKLSKQTYLLHIHSCSTYIFVIPSEVTLLILISRLPSAQTRGSFKSAQQESRCLSLKELTRWSAVTSLMSTWLPSVITHISNLLSPLPSIHSNLSSFNLQSESEEMTI